MTNILLTGGRAPVTLDLARAFHRAGHTVFMAESLRGHLSQPSNAVKAHFVVPAPRQELRRF
jgi:short-subunit dehydrogenase involved in D-alanine esterification of teichoic acids